MTDTHAIRAAWMEADARCNTARKLAEEAQNAAAVAELGKYPDRAVAHLKADRALVAFHAAMEARERALRALRMTMEEAS